MTLIAKSGSDIEEWQQILYNMQEWQQILYNKEEWQQKLCNKEEWHQRLQQGRVETKTL